MKKIIGRNFEVKRLTDKAEITAAFRLAEDVFMRYEAPEFSEKGVKSFLDFLWGKRVAEKIEDGSFAVWGCYSEGMLAGMMAMRDCDHISLAFVSGEFQRMGAGSALYAEAKKLAIENGADRITVNASRFGIPFYRTMGFAETDMELITDGIIYTPMAVKIK